MLEVLITLVIVSISVLGLAGLQIISVKNTESGLVRSNVAFLANDIMDRIAINPLANQAGQYNIALGADALDVNCEGLAVTCTTAQLAEYDKKKWKDYLSDYLINGDGSINTVATPVGANIVYVSTITIQWLDEYQSDNPLQSAQFIMRVPQ